MTNRQITTRPPSTPRRPPPPVPFRDQPVLQRKIFRKLKEKELFQRSLEPLAHWCHEVNGQLSHMPLESVQGLMDKVLRETANVFHSLTKLKSPSHPREITQLKAALRALPDPAHPSFSASMAEVNAQVSKCAKQEENQRNTKVRWCLVQCTRVKKTLAEALRPSEPPTLAMKDPSTPGERTTDLKEISNIFSDTLLHLGGDPTFLPPDALERDLLQHTPSCPPEVTSQPRTEYPPPPPAQCPHLSSLSHIKHVSIPTHHPT